MLTSRRTLFQSLGAVAGTLSAVRLAVATPAKAGTEVARPYLTAAEEVARWISLSRVPSRHGLTWPAQLPEIVFDNVVTDTDTLYAQGPGIVLFLLELYSASGKEQYLREALAGADHLIAVLPRPSDRVAVCLYWGMAGTAYALECAHAVSRQRKYRNGAADYFDSIKARARRVSGGASWDENIDVLVGSAGTALTLLWWADAVDDPESRELAAQAGHTVIERAEPTPDGNLRWRWRVAAPTYTPNFNHGTAGTAYFLTTLYGKTHEQRFLEAALAGTRHLQAIADNQGNETRISRNVDDAGRPSGQYMWDWSHGPIGTWRLFYRLAEVTGQREWNEWVHRLARAVLSSGIPDEALAGYTHDASWCYGDAGIAQGFLDLYRAYGNPEYSTFALRVNAALMSRATLDGRGMRWLQAFDRSKPDVLTAETGFARGAAGTGTWLLHLDGWQRQRPEVVVLPDSPFRSKSI
jgi:lantibiotic modifying enzyme